MNVAVCIPYRAGVPERDRNFVYVAEWWRHETDWPVLTGDDEGETVFSAGRARNRAASSAWWDVAVFTDADMIPGSVGQVFEAVQAAAETGSYATLHSEIRYVSEARTEAVCAGDEQLTVDAVRSVRHGVWVPSCAIRRDLWEQVGGYDERIRGYGGEDLAFFFAASTLGDAIRTEGPLYHLWHPDVPEAHRLNETWAVVNAYSGASGDVDAMRAVIAEARG